MANDTPFPLPRCIFFDLDGTLLDSLPGITHSVNRAFAACSLPMLKTDLRKQIGPPVRTILARLAGEISEHDLDRLEQAFRASYDGDGWRMTHCYPGAREILLGMRGQDLRLFVVSNKPRHIAVQILEAEGTAALFEEIVTKDSRQPHYSGKDEMIAMLLASHGLESQECMMVGDTIEDGLAAAKAKMKFILMTHGYGDVLESAEVPVALRMSHFSEFMPLLTKEIVG
ncbi:MAG TPA: HAD family hydrolase [Acidobacteriaceae bacterium]